MLQEGSAARWISSVLTGKNNNQMTRTNQTITKTNVVEICQSKTVVKMSTVCHPDNVCYVPCMLYVSSQSNNMLSMS